MDADHIHELFSAFGAVQVRRMFGGAGLFVDGLMFGLVVDGRIFLKADKASMPNFEREGCGPFAYATKTGRRAVMSYWQMPDRLYDDADELAQWARVALATARSGAAAKSKPGVRGSRKKSRR